MSLVCPACDSASLEIDVRLLLPADDNADERSAQALACRGCSFRGFATYEAERRGSDERWHHWGWPVDDETFQALRARFASCPRPDARGCACPEHAAMSAADKDGYWRPENRVKISGERFAVRLR